MGVRAADDMANPQGFVIAAWVSPGYTHDQFTSSMLGVAAWEPRLKGAIAARGTRRLASMNAAIESFLGLPPAFEWLWHVDTDMVFQKDALTTLLATAVAQERKVVGGITGVFKDKNVRDPFDTRPSFTRFDKVNKAWHMPNEWPNDRYVEADATGEFCLLLHRSVLEAVRTYYGHERYTWWDDISPNMYEEATLFHRIKESTDETPLIDMSVRPMHIQEVLI